MAGWIALNRALTVEEMENNAVLVYKRLKSEGWTLQCISAVIANMEAESRINPGAWESYNYGNMSGGYGLCQWTPATKYINWAGDAWENNGDLQLSRLVYESTLGGQYWVYRYEDKSWTWKKFIASTDDPYLLSVVFCWNFEGSWTVLYGSDEEKAALRKYRGSLAYKWWDFIQEQESTIVVNTRRRLPIWMMCRRPI